ncbi:hypothetical protein [Alteriqipengyuania sp.]|uniref:hypothetical protein n=1 Tax=Alteriqipengyuania sp. TaxID=2800692 RepID=UPI0035164E46
MRMSAPARFALAASIAVLAACTPSQDETPGAPEPDSDVLAQKPDNCLLVVWQEQDRRDEQFDLAHDSADGGAISCATGTSASQFADAFSAIRTAARSEDRAAILQEVGLPLLYIDAEGQRRELTDPGAVDATFAEVFDDDVLALLRDVDLDALTVVPDEGAFVELGSVWLVVDQDGGRPRIVTVNKQALGEAAAAVRAEAEAGGGTEAPAKPSE